LTPTPACFMRAVHCVTLEVAEAQVLARARLVLAP